MSSFEFKWSKPGKSISTKALISENNKTPKVPLINNNVAKKVIKTRKLDPKKVKLNEKPNNATTKEAVKFIRRKSKKEKNNPVNKSTTENNVAHKSGQNNKAHSMYSENYKNIHIDSNIKGVSVVEKVFSASKFGDLNLHLHLLSNLLKNNFITMTNVQKKSIPEVISGKHCLIRSQTGSGKTLTYAVPILNTLINILPKIKRADGIQAIVVVPTRELALQTHEIFGKLNSFQWIIVSHLCGGENRKTEKDKLRKGVHVLVATPGRLLDHILHTTAFNGKNVKYLILDEADRLLDMGFKKDIVRLVEELDRFKENSTYDPLALLKGTKKTELAEEPTTTRQIILLSATLTKEIAELADFIMKEHIYIDALDNSTSINPQHMIIPNTVKQEFILTFIKHRLVILSALLITNSKHKGKTIIFMATTQMVDFHYELFKKCLLKMPKNKGKMKIADIVVLDEMDLDDLSDDNDEEDVLDLDLFKLHGNMNQQERKDVFNGFRKADKGILICTDVAARGIDVSEADCIVQFTGPQSDEDYLHRVGRTGRAGKSGHALIFLTHEEQDYVSWLQDHKVFLKQHDPTLLMNNLKDFMEEPDPEKATIALQRRYEAAISKDRSLHGKACFAYSSWSRYYSGFPGKLRSIFDLRNVNIGHYVTSFGLQEAPTAVSKFVKGQIKKTVSKNFNKKLANHEDNEELIQRRPKKRMIKSISLTTSEYGSGLVSAKKRKKKINT